jgi:hypothetical protein
MAAKIEADMMAEFGGFLWRHPDSRGDSANQRGAGFHRFRTLIGISHPAFRAYTAPSSRKWLITFTPN